MYNMENHGKDIVEDNHEDKGNFYTLMWEVYMKEKEDLINSGFCVVVLHP